MVEAAAIPLVGLPSWQALIEIAGLRKGQKVFIQAGSGGVGTFAIQLAKHLGATVATTAGAANHDLVDVVVHSLDEATLMKSLRVLKPGGKLISISGPSDPAFARELGKPWILRPATRILSHHPAGHGPRLPVRSNQRSHRVCPQGTRQGQSRHQGEMTRQPGARP